MSDRGTIEIDVETVENWQKAVEHIASSIRFWFPRNDKDWPFNLFLDNLDLISEEISHKITPF